MWDAEGRYFPDEKNAAKKPLLSSEDAQFSGVKTEGRRCNDILFAVLFLLMFVGMGVVNGVGFVKGNPEKLIPSNEYDLYNATETAEFWFQDSVAHLKKDIDLIGLSLLVAFVLGFIWLQLMRIFTKLFIYITVALGILAVIAGGVYTVMLGQQNDSDLKIVGYCLFGFAFLLIVAVIFLRKKINLTAALFTECCHGVNHNTGLMPIATLIFVLLVAFVAYWIAGFLFLFSIVDDSVQVDLPNQMPQFNTRIRNLLYFNVFGFYWTVSLLSGVFQVSVAGAIASWYFARETPRKAFPSFRSLGHAATKSLGSVAFGSLILAVVEFLDFLIRQVKMTPSNNKAMQCISCVLKGFLSCIQALVRFVNRFAFISIAMHGEAFCPSARSAYDLISRNSFSAVIVDTLSDFVLFVGKLLGTVASAMFAMFMLHILNREISLATMVAVVVVSFVVFSIFANIVAVGVDTIMVCYLEDLERNKSNNMNIEPSLHEMLQQKRRQAMEINS